VPAGDRFEVVTEDRYLAYRETGELPTTGAADGRPARPGDEDEDEESVTTDGIPLDNFADDDADRTARTGDER
jgi:hypothetical protein